MPDVRGMFRLCGIHIARLLSAWLESFGVVGAGGKYGLSLVRMFTGPARIDTVRAENQCLTIAGRRYREHLI